MPTHHQFFMRHSFRAVLFFCWQEPSPSGPTRTANPESAINGGGHTPAKTIGHGYDDSRSGERTAARSVCPPEPSTLGVFVCSRYLLLGVYSRCLSVCVGPRPGRVRAPVLNSPKLFTAVAVLCIYFTSLSSFSASLFRPMLAYL